MNNSLERVLKRIDKEQKDNLIPADYFYTQPLSKDKYEWHFTILGVEDTPFEKGIYHGYFKLPKDYPMNPPDVYFTTPNGRFQVNSKICLNITGYHKEAWTPAWSLRTMVQAICAYMLVNEYGIGAIFDNDKNRKEYAMKSRKFCCPHCGSLANIESLIISNRANNNTNNIENKDSTAIEVPESKLNKRNNIKENTKIESSVKAKRVKKAQNK